MRNIFKKYGFTVSAVVLAVGTTIGKIVSAFKRGLKFVAKGIGNGFKTLGSKIAAILPGLIGSIIGFIFKTAGSVISFVGQNAWLLIMRVTVFMVERFQKNKQWNTWSQGPRSDPFKTADTSPAVINPTFTIS